MITYLAARTNSFEKIARDMVVIARALGDHVEAFCGAGAVSLGFVALADDPCPPARQIQLLVQLFRKWHLNSLYGKTSDKGGLV
jgi:hypothetical protein